MKEILTKKTKNVTDKPFFSKIDIILLSCLFGVFLILIMTFIINNNGMWLLFASLMAYTISMYGLVKLVEIARRWLFENEGNLGRLAAGYFIFIITAILIFGLGYYYNSKYSHTTGYLTYSPCNDQSTITPEMFNSDKDKVTSFGGSIYFSAITFFSVGYGDICPMGWFRYISIINSFMGNFFVVIVIALSLINYQQYLYKKNGRKKSK